MVLNNKTYIETLIEGINDEKLTFGKEDLNLIT
jgi:hypothetical protein